jgi:glycosyltransferase involved in cell wall biosynthesis
MYSLLHGNSMPNKSRVLLVHNIMAPYRFPLFRALADEPGVDLTVWFMSRSARNRRWAKAGNGDLGFRYAVLPGFQLSYFARDLFTYVFNYTFPWRYLSEHFDVLISAGWLDFAAQAGWSLSKMSRRRFILWSESTAFEPSWRRSLAAPWVRTVVQHSDACVSVGSRSRQYLRMLGARESNIFTAFSTVDVAHFQRVSYAARMNRDHRKQALGIRRRRVILYCGQFIERKGLRTLVNAYAAIKSEFEDVSLVLVGYGPLQQSLERLIAARALEDVHFLNHVELSEMPELYAIADLFVLASREETWGLVVNEAMASGLPVIVTDGVGCAPDLVVEGANGYVVAVGDSNAIAARCLDLLRNEERLVRFSECATSHIHGYTPERAARQFARAVYHVTGLSTAM